MRFVYNIPCDFGTASSASVPTHTWLEYFSFSKNGLLFINRDLNSVQPCICMFHCNFLMSPWPGK